jgi:hypothetical protein
VISQDKTGILTRDIQVSITMKSQAERMAKAWISGGVRLNKDFAEVMLAVSIQFPAEAENLAVIPKRVRDIKVSIRAKGVTAQLPELDIFRNTILVQRFPHLPPIE